MQKIKRRKARKDNTGYGKKLTGELIQWERQVFPVTREAPVMGWWRYLQDAHRIGPKAWRARYKLYLYSAQWYKLRAAVLQAALWHCQGCGQPNPRLEVHHRTYQRVGREEPNDLRALCKACHEVMHMDARGVAWHDRPAVRHQREVLRKRLKSPKLMALVRELAAEPEEPRRIRRRPGGVKPTDDKAPSLAVGGVSAGVCGETRQPS